MTELTLTQQIITIGVCVLASMLVRFLPFAVFRDGDHAPLVVQYLGRVLPLGLFAMLVVYCLRDVSLLSGTHGVPEAIAIIVTTIFHFWRHNMCLSMAAGTLVYMFLVQVVFI